MGLYIPEEEVVCILYSWIYAAVHLKDNTVYTLKKSQKGSNINSLYHD